MRILNIARLSRLKYWLHPSVRKAIQVIHNVHQRGRLSARAIEDLARYNMAICSGHG
jgi:hypothetical protein